MLTTGLVSVTFRKLSVEEIIKLASTAGLESIEWGGDVHVPHGEVETATQVKQMTTDAGLTVSAYGSYYRLAEDDSPSFDAVIDTADALGTDLIRVWAGRRGSDDADADYWQAVVEDAQGIVDIAQARNIRIALEHHRNTLTDATASALRLLQAVDSPYFLTYWQPPHTHDFELKQQSLRAFLPELANVHVFHWHPNTIERYPLVDGADEWRTYLDMLATSERDHVLSLEFVRDDDETQFFADAQTLHSWIASVSSKG